jgi:5-methylthioribose kinase
MPEAASDPRIDRVLTRLVEQGVVGSADGATVVELSGGVSADVFALTVGSRRLVVKWALPRLRVAQEWLSSPSRIVVEADATSYARTIRPENAPEIVDVDRLNLVIVMTAAPPEMGNWKSSLLNGSIDAGVGRSLGSALADWHSASSSDPDAFRRFGDRRYFVELRVAPFFKRVGGVHRDLQAVIDGIVDRMMERSICLVHGDFSPKNVLVNEGSFWVLDWEIAHIGDPTFDLAFLVSHLACKAIHRPAQAHLYESCARSFLDAYAERSFLDADHHDLVPQAGCLLLARVDGKSPVDYFDAAQTQRARALGRRLLVEGTTDLAALWHHLEVDCQAD